MRGQPAAGERDNTRAMWLLNAVVDAIRASPAFRPLDALVFPGGFFRLPFYIGDQPFEERARRIAGSAVGETCIAAARRLETVAPGARLIVGLDSRHPRPSIDFADQLCAAFGAGGVVGIGRKVFPADGDTNGDGRYPLLCYAADYASPARIVRLANGGRAVLCACYDVFGVAVVAEGMAAARCRGIRYLAEPGGEERWIGEPGFAERRARLVAAWRELLLDEKVDVAIGAVHRFARPGRDIFWQRHGIAAASAALGGGLAVGASFFRAALPGRAGAWDSPLAAAGVPTNHLARGQHRPADRLSPRVAVTIEERRRHGAARALVRLFEGATCE